MTIKVCIDLSPPGLHRNDSREITITYPVCGQRPDSMSWPRENKSSGPVRKVSTFTVFDSSEWNFYSHVAKTSTKRMELL
jgi:hypothetical protein